jgi:ankyrin repeat protein
VSETNPLRALGEHPDLRQLEQQANELVAAYRAGDADALAEVSMYVGATDAAAFAPDAAQLVLARAYGFASWAQLAAFVNGATVSRLIAAVRAGDVASVTRILEARPEIINMDAADDDEHRALHHAVQMRSPEMVRLLMEHGADSRIGIYPHRVPTTAIAMAIERGYDDVVAIIQEVEEKRTGIRGTVAPTDASPMPRELDDAIRRADSAAAIAFLESSPLIRAEPALIRRTGPGGITLLHIAAARLMVDLVRWLLAHGADANARTGDGLVPISMVGRWPVSTPHDGATVIADMLLRHGAERTPFWAVATNNLDWLRARHAEGTLNNQVTDVGGFVSLAVRLDRPEALTLLLELGFDPDERMDTTGRGGKPLEYCAKTRRTDLAEILLRHGATLTPTLAVALGEGDWLRARHADRSLAHPPQGDGLLTVAVEHDRPDMLQLLLELGFDAQERRRTVGGDGVYESCGIPLERAAGRGSLAMAEMLLAHGADPNGEGGPSPMWTAYRKRDRAMLDLLTKYGGQVSAVTAAYHRDVAIARQRIQEEDAGQLPRGAVSPGRTVAEDLLTGDCGEPEIIRMALERLDWAPDDSRWYTALRGPLAFWNHVPWIATPEWPLDRDGYLACFRLLLARGNANARGSFGRTILHDVMAMGFHDGVSGWVTEDEALAFAVTLLDAGARTDVRDDLLQSTPLGWACRWGRIPIVRELLRRGVTPDEPDAPAWATPRAWASKMGHREMVAILDRR